MEKITLKIKVKQKAQFCSANMSALKKISAIFDQILMQTKGVAIHMPWFDIDRPLYFWFLKYQKVKIQAPDPEFVFDPKSIYKSGPW